MRILYVALEHDYGRPEAGPSFEEMNFRSAFEGMGHELVRFDFKARERAVGRRAMNRELVARAADARADLAFFFLAEDEIRPDTIRAVAREGRTMTMNWFADDHWRFESFSRHYAPAFDWSVTTDHAAPARYRAIGYERAILSQWACNRYAYTKTATGIDHEVTFVGIEYGDRAAVAERIAAAGYAIECWGSGWPNGRLAHDEMVRVFGSSRINLNLPASWVPPPTFRQRLTRRPPERRPDQIKGRTFEVPGSGGSLLTGRVANLEQYFELDREVAVFESTDDLVERIAHWLAHEGERAAVAEAGYRRVLAEHTYDHRFAAIFATAGLG